ncbi:MAG: PH domain-containing protein [bacterium]
MEETILYHSHPAMFKNRPFAFILCLILCFVGIGLLICLVWWIKTRGTELTVTNERVSLRKGILSKFTNDVYLTDIRNVQIYQSFGQRIFGVGSVAISSAGNEGIEIEVKGIPRPDKIKVIIDAHRRDRD